MTDNYLFNKNYIRIKNLGTESYGGNQSWSKSKKLQKIGCGVFALADISIYLAEQNPNMMTDEIRNINKPNGFLNKNDYVEYVRKFYNKYVYVVLGKEMRGLSLKSAMNRFFYLNHIKLKAHWKNKMSYEDMMKDIRHLIRKNKPVILSIGGSLPAGISEDKKIKFYLEKNGKFIESTKTNVNPQYVVITGVVERMGKEYLVASSWGNKYFISYKEYNDFVESQGQRLTSGLLYIKGNI